MEETVLGTENRFIRQPKSNLLPMMPSPTFLVGLKKAAKQSKAQAFL